MDPLVNRIGPNAHRHRLQDSIALWRKTVPEYGEPHFAMTSTALKPDRVDIEVVGHFMCCVFARGIRTWVFRGQAQRDNFVNHYRPFNARPCRNPYP